LGARRRRHEAVYADQTAPHVTTTDEDLGFVTITNYRQDWPFTGMALSSTTTSKNGVVIAATENRFAPKPISQANGQTTIFTLTADTTTNNKRDLYGSDIGSKGGQASSAHPVMLSEVKNVQSIAYTQ
jgi:hypothetical protein